MGHDSLPTIDATELPEAGDELRVFLVVYHADRSRVVELREGEEVTFGRSRDATVDIEDPRVSRLHAAVARRGGFVFVRDLGSRNGTRVNGETLRGERRLSAGDEISIGGASVIVGVRTPPAAMTAVGPLSEGAGGSGTGTARVQERRTADGSDERPHDTVVVVDPAMRRVFELARRVAASPMTVLLLGETGVGKEVVAEEIHRRSPRAHGPLVKLNCASLPETLLEAELFGSERGAYTGAERRRRGYFEAASGGTLLLDEIGEMPLSTQAKLLRVLESKAITRLGGTEEIPVDVRVVAATNRDLQEQVRAGRFREDLFFRVSAFTLHVPPLRDRRCEIVPLCELYAREFAEAMGIPTPSFTDAARAKLLAYAWPGNVRELRNVVERAVVLGSNVIDVADLPPQVQGAVQDQKSEQQGAGAARAASARGLAEDREHAGDGGVGMTDRMAEIERALIEEALRACGGNQTRAAQRLGITRRALIYKMEKLGLKPPPPSAR